jgi:hypothetical protein
MNKAAGAPDPLEMVMRYHQETKHHFSRYASMDWDRLPRQREGGLNIRGTNSARMLQMISPGRTYELAGPGVYTLRELVSFVLRLIDKRRLLVPVPFAVAEIQARLFEFLPSPPLTTSQVDLLREDNLPSGELPGFRDLNMRAQAVEDIVPTYVGRRRAP